MPATAKKHKRRLGRAKQITHKMATGQSKRRIHRVDFNMITQTEAIVILVMGLVTFATLRHIWGKYGQ